LLVLVKRSLNGRQIQLLARILVGLLVVLAVGLAVMLTLGGVRSPDLLRLFADLLESCRVVGYVIYVVTFFLAVTVGIVPLSLIAILGGALYGTVTGFALSLAAMLPGSVVAFLLSRYAFRAPIRRWLSHHLVLSRIDDEIALRGWRFVLLLRLSPIVPFSVASYAFGLTTVQMRAYLLGTLGVLPALLMFVYTGQLSGLALVTALGGQPEFGRLETISLAVGLFFTLVTVAYFMRIARRSIRRDLLQSTSIEGEDSSNSEHHPTYGSK
jgi:uncharacterized membrane protein YdjX (TVP38/TMEM64 family)